METLYIYLIAITSIGISLYLIDYDIERENECMSEHSSTELTAIVAIRALFIHVAITIIVLIIS